MNKADLIAQISTGSRGIAKVEPVLAGGKDPEIITLDNGKEVRKYTVNVCVHEGEATTFRNIPIIVFNEGEADEEAVLSQGAEAPKTRDFTDKAKNYLQNLVQANTLLAYRITEVNEDFKYAKALIIKNEAGVMKETAVVVYKPNGSPITHLPYTAE